MASPITSDTGTPTPAPEEQVNPVTEAALDRRIGELEKTLERIAKPVWAVAIGIIVVLFIGFVATLTAMLALVNESNNFKMTAYQQLSQEVQSYLSQRKGP